MMLTRGLTGRDGLAYKKRLPARIGWSGGSSPAATGAGEQTGDAGLNTYDIMFIFPATLTDEQYDKLFETAQAEITRVGGTVARTERMGRRPYARPIAKRVEGLYGRAWAKIDPTQIDALTARYNLNEEIVRVQIRRLQGDVPPVTTRTLPVGDGRSSEGSRYGESQ